jgi:hypothetical protein
MITAYLHDHQALVLAQLATFQHLLELRNRSRNLLLRILRDD